MGMKKHEMSGMSKVAPEGLFALEGISTAQRIADHLREQIVQGSIRSGQQINEYAWRASSTCPEVLSGKHYSACVRKESSSIGATTDCSFPKLMSMTVERLIRSVSPSNPPRRARYWMAAPGRSKKPVKR